MGLRGAKRNHLESSGVGSSRYRTMICRDFFSEYLRAVCYLVIIDKEGGTAKEDLSSF